MAVNWSNWSGSQQHLANRFEQPDTEEKLVLLMEMARTSDRKIRAVGSAHSFVPFWTEDFLVSLNQMKGLVGCDEKKRQATFWAGTKLHEMGDVLWKHGLSMENMGDIDRQSIAGAVSTGTHGTGCTLQNIPSQLADLRLVMANGEVMDIESSNDELFRAAQVSLGTLGIISQATFNVLPAYYLHEKNWSASIEECAEQRDALIEDNRHWEFFWDPTSDQCAMKTLNITDREEDIQLNKNESIGRSYRIIPSDREFKFNEIEFSVPEDAGWACFLEIRALVKTKFPNVRWPIEYRTLKKDNMLLSSASGRDSVTISAHEGIKNPFEAFFLAVEEVFRRYGGRPHWGKIHSCKARDLQRTLPGFDRFCEIRHQFDPEGRFLNPFLQEIFGIN
jgi:FAD/FMN-containing dehydrogenase